MTGDRHVVDAVMSGNGHVGVERNDSVTLFLDQPHKQRRQRSGRRIEKSEVELSAEGPSEKGIGSAAAVDEGVRPAAFHPDIVDGKRPVEVAGQIHGRHDVGEAQRMPCGFLPVFTIPKRPTVR